MDRTFIGFNNESPEVCHRTASETSGDCFINIRSVETMTEKINLTNEQEGIIALYCAKNDIEFNQANAYDVTLQAFKHNPILYIKTDTITREETKIDVTTRIARLVECNRRMVERIADKADLKRVDVKQENFKSNIQKANIDSKPDLEMLVENLSRLNIVDEHSYLAFVCFLMQLKYSRDNEIPENDKTCVFFNGVARNGKSATARAIYDVESQYGDVFKAQSGKLLESTHEEQVWKSHLNYFDEVKPTDIDRELLLTIVNGGDIELNPKNKKPYTHHVNTNNIFTSNDQISLKQRRVSIIKFGNRLNGRPLENGTLKNIITNIMNSLPDFKYYYALYNIVSVYNENRVNALAMSNIITYMTEKFGFVTAEDERTLTATKSFAPHDIYNCVKGTYSKQIITSERKEAINTALEHLEEKGFIGQVKYENCTTRYYTVTGENYIKIMDEYNKINTKDEDNRKIGKGQLYECLLPFFDNVPDPNGKNPYGESIDYSWMAPLMENDSPTATDNCMSVSADTKARGNMFFNILLKQLKCYTDGDLTFDMPYDKGYSIDDVLKQYITKDVCENISYKWLGAELLETYKIRDFGEKQCRLLKDLYMQNLGITDENTLDTFDKYKISSMQQGCPVGMKIESKYNFTQRKIQERREEKKRRDAEYKREKRKLEKERKKAQL